VNKIQVHHLYCLRFIVQLERAQNLLLHLNQRLSGYEQELIYLQFLAECSKVQSLFADKKDGGGQSFLLNRQLRRICCLIQSFFIINEKIKAEQLTPIQIIDHFEDQHRLKKILKRHLADLDHYIASTQPVTDIS